MNESDWRRIAVLLGRAGRFPLSDGEREEASAFAVAIGRDMLPRWTGTPMKTHAACLPGEGCRVEPGMRFEAAKAFLAAILTGREQVNDEDVRSAVRIADVLLAELGKP